MLKRIFIALVPISLSKDQTQNNASMRCFVFPDFTYAVVKVLLDIKLIIQLEPSILSKKFLKLLLKTLLI